MTETNLCKCGNRICDESMQEVGRSMYCRPRYTCSNQCHNDSILGINAFEGAGYPVGKGWMPLVLECHRKLTALDPEYYIVQIKEKFGTLRYYCDSSGSKDMRPRIRMSWKERSAIGRLIRDMQTHLDQGTVLSDEKYRRSAIKDASELLKRSKNKFDAVIDEAEELSANTCEICGDPGKSDNTGNWILTLCEAHSAKRSEGIGTFWELMEDHETA